MSPGALARPVRVADDPIPGVNLAGFLEGHVGLGEVARKLERALGLAGIPHVSIPYRRTPYAHTEELRQDAANAAPYDTNVICLNADYLHAFAQDVGTGFFSKRYSVGVWFWETNVFQEQHRVGFRFLDEVWVASEYVRKATSPVSPIPVVVAPLPIDAPPEARHGRGELGLPDAFLFLFTFDFVSFDRKNPLAVLEAFDRAFAPGEGPVLVLKSVNGERKPARLTELRERCSERPDVVLLDRYLPVEENNALVAACDCFISLHRSEGFGLTMAEAMAHGKPVIATGYSGNLEFMRDDNSHLVPYELVDVPPGWWAYAPGARWAEPEVETAAGFMRRVWECPDEASALGEQGRRHVLEQFTVERTAAFVRSRLEDARARGAIDARASSSDARPPILEASRALAGGVGGSLVDGRRVSASSVLRRVLRRALWPHLEDQGRLQASMLDALTALERSVEALEQRVRQMERAGPPDGGTGGGIRR